MKVTLIHNMTVKYYNIHYERERKRKNYSTGSNAKLLTLWLQIEANTHRGWQSHIYTSITYIICEPEQTPATHTIRPNGLRPITKSFSTIKIIRSETNVLEK